MKIIEIKSPIDAIFAFDTLQREMATVRLYLAYLHKINASLSEKANYATEQSDRIDTWVEQLNKVRLYVKPLPTP